MSVAAGVASPQTTQRDTRTVLIVVGIMILTVAAGVFYGSRFGEDEPNPKNEPSGVLTYSYEGGDHTGETVNYEEVPPVGGPHADVWQNCGFYDGPVVPEQAVHSLEHGAVWITYQPDLALGEVAKLRDLAQRNSYILVSSYAGLPSPIVASAWNHQLSFSSADDTQLNAFIVALMQGSEAPEPGAPCSGGTSELAV